MSATLALAELKTKLATVAPVLTGRPALETTSATLPVITITTLGESPADDQGYIARQYTRQIVVEYKIKAGAGYDAALDAAARAIRGALRPLVGLPILENATSLTESSVRWMHPEPHGDHAALQMFYDLNYLERF